MQRNMNVTVTMNMVQYSNFLNRVSKVDENISKSMALKLAVEVAMRQPVDIWKKEYEKLKKR